MHDLQGPQLGHSVSGDMPVLSGNDQILFSELLDEAKKIPFEGAGMSILNFVVKLLHIKVINKMTKKVLI